MHGVEAQLSSTIDAEASLNVIMLSVFSHIPLQMLRYKPEHCGPNGGTMLGRVAFSKAARRQSSAPGGGF